MDRREREKKSRGRKLNVLLPKDHSSSASLVKLSHEYSNAISPPYSAASFPNHFSPRFYRVWDRDHFPDHNLTQIDPNERLPLGTARVRRKMAPSWLPLPFLFHSDCSGRDRTWLKVPPFFLFLPLTECVCLNDGVGCRHRRRIVSHPVSRMSRSRHVNLCPANIRSHALTYSKYTVFQLMYRAKSIFFPLSFRTAFLLRLSTLNPAHCPNPPPHVTPAFPIAL